MAEELPKSDATLFERFTDLTRRLGAVPKSKVTEIEGAEREARAKSSEAQPQ
jgi:hypothetical protein